MSKPCPFCGKRDLNKFNHSSFTADGPVTREKTQCKNCEAETRSEFWDQRAYESVWDNLESAIDEALKREEKTTDALRAAESELRDLYSDHPVRIQIREALASATPKGGTA